jgi:hypothetical protein
MKSCVIGGVEAISVATTILLFTLPIGTRLLSRRIGGVSNLKPALPLIPGLAPQRRVRPGFWVKVTITRRAKKIPEIDYNSGHVRTS